MSVFLDSISQGAVESATSLTIAHTTGSGSDRVLYVLVNNINGADLLLTGGVTYNGVSLGAPIHSRLGVSNRTYVWRLINPPTGTFNIVITPSASAFMQAYVIGLRAVDQTTPEGSIVSSGAEFQTTPVLNSVTLSAGGMAIDMLTRRIAESTPAPDGSQTRNGTAILGSVASSGSSRKSGAGSTAMVWTYAATSNATHVVIPVNAAPGADTTAPVLTSPTGTATGSTTATVGATTDEGNGTLYAFVSTSSTPPAAATLKAGTGAAWAGSVAVSSTGAKTLSATGLTASTGYYAHLLHTDDALNNSNSVTSAQFTTSPPAATAITLTGPSGGQVGVASAAFTVGANGAISGSHTVTPSDGGAGGSFSPANVTISAGTPTATFTYTPSTVGARTISATDAGGYTAPTSLTYTATSTAGTLTSSPLKNNTGTLLTGVAFEAFVNNPTSGALVVKKTGLTSSGAGVVTFADGALAAASSYRVVWRRTDTGAEGLETLTAT